MRRRLKMTRCAKGTTPFFGHINANQLIKHDVG